MSLTFTARSRHGFALAALLLASSAFAQPTSRLVSLEPVADGDFVPRSLVAPGGEPPLALAHEAVRVAYKVPAETAITSAPAPLEQSSYAYVVEVSAAKLRAGVTLVTSADRAFLRLSPGNAEQLAGGAEALAVDPAGLVVRTTAGLTLSGVTAFELIGDAASIGALEFFPAGTVIVRLGARAGHGSLVLSAPALTGDAEYQIHVEDDETAVALRLSTDRVEHFDGDTVTIRARLEEATGGTLAVSTLEGRVVAPGAQSWPVAFTPERDGSYTASLVLDAAAVDELGPWQVWVTASGRANGLEIVRQASTAFLVSRASAGLRGPVEVHNDGSTATLRFPVTVASPGRYAVQGVLYGTDPATGSLRPVVVLETADHLAIDGDLIGQVGLCDLVGVTAPFELRDLRLLDQSRDALLHRQSVGLRLADL